jgi:5-methylcytosine-specific restriction endonuclease McrA
MTWDAKQLDRIYQRTRGKCHLCSKQLARTNYGAHGARGAWEVEHSVPKASGGTDHGNNLYAACIPCNRKKQAKSTRRVRTGNGLKRAPLPKDRYERAKRDKQLGGAMAGATFGGLVAGPIGALAGAVFGTFVGDTHNPDQD